MRQLNDTWSDGNQPRMVHLSEEKAVKRFLVFIAMALAMAAAHAQQYPVKSIRFIVPYPPGGGTDLMGRTLAQKLTEALGQQVVVENRSGAQGNNGTALAAKAAPDGYTIALSYVGTLAINPWLYKDAGFDPIRDFAQISLTTVQPYVIVVNPRVPVRTLKELAATAKAKPDSLTFASSASAGQLAAELFKIVTKTKMTHIPYKGAGPAVIDLIGGHVDLMFSSPASSVPQVKAGKLRALAVTSPTRMGALPDVLTSKESGFPDLEIGGWYGIAAPAGTPRDIVNRLNAETVKALALKDVKDRLAGDGLETKTNTPDEMTAFVKAEYERWGKVVKAAGMKVE
jgi:tripartite-type tricarboxylate transporter receptor subunit TctC